MDLSDREIWEKEKHDLYEIFSQKHTSALYENLDYAYQIHKTYSETDNYLDISYTIKKLSNENSILKFWLEAKANCILKYKKMQITRLCILLIIFTVLFFGLTYLIESVDYESEALRDILISIAIRLSTSLMAATVHLFFSLLIVKNIYENDSFKILWIFVGVFAFIWAISFGMEVLIDLQDFDGENMQDIVENYIVAIVIFLGAGAILSYFNLGICSIAFEPIIEENRHMSHIETEIEKTSKHINDIETKLIKDLCNKIASGKDALSKM